MMIGMVPRFLRAYVFEDRALLSAVLAKPPEWEVRNRGLEGRHQGYAVWTTPAVRRDRMRPEEFLHGRYEI